MLLGVFLEGERAAQKRGYEVGGQQAEQEEASVCMESPLKDVEPRVQKVLLQLMNEITIFERLMYKNANQHRRALYFRRLCQVRRDLRLLQAAHLTELIQNIARCFGNASIEPSLQKGRWQSKNISTEVQSLSRRLYGVARLLEQMSDPILHASAQVAGLLGQTFFMPFALTTLSILARLRVLVLQCLHDFAEMFNLFSAWVLEKGHFGHDHNHHELPAFLESKWDGTKLLLAATFRPHQPASRTENKDFVEDCHGRKYSILESLVSGDTASDHVEIQDEDIKEIIPSTSLTSTVDDKDVVCITTLSVEKSDAYNSVKQLKQPDVLEDRKDKSKGHSTCTDSIPVSKKKVAYVSIMSTSGSEKEKVKEEIPPLKKQKKDTLFDMLLGLGDQTHETLF